MALEGGRAARRARTDLQIMGELHTRLRTLYTSEGGTFPDPIVNLFWPYAARRARHR